MLTETPPDKDHIAELLESVRSAGSDEEKKKLDEQHEHVLTQLFGKTWGELEVLENDGYLLFPEKLYRRSLGGKFEAEDVLIRIPREPEQRKARIDARALALEEGLDLDRDADLVENLETTCLMTLCIRNANVGKGADGKEFYEPWILDPRQLEKRYDQSSLTQLFAKIESLALVVDPRPNSIGNMELLTLISAISKERNIAPLHVFGPGVQNSCIVSMADLCLRLLASRSSSVQSAA